MSSATLVACVSLLAVAAVRAQAPAPLKADEKAAILLLSLGPDFGRPILEELDEMEIKVLSRAMVRVGAVTQDVQLFSASVADNLTLFAEEADASRLRDVLQEVGLGPWHASLPDGLDTELGPAGIGMSAGEAQLLALARIFLADPSVVLLDEPTSRLDPATEELVEKATARLLRGRTGVVIAHRLASPVHVDDVAVLENGRVVEHGPREALAADPASRFFRLLQPSEARS
jgi:ABC-type multidrug transport system fused ATPase/permease subunit